nr:hypothetical protein [Tanacetum cinerariifolium]
MTSLTRLGATLAIPSIFIGGWHMEANQRSRSITWRTNMIGGLGLEMGGASKRPKEEKGINKQAQKKQEVKSIAELLVEEQAAKINSLYQDHNPLKNFIRLNGNDDDDDYDKESIISTNMDIFETPPSIVITTSSLVLPIEDPEVFLIIGNEELNNILENELDKFIKSSVGDLVPIPSESEDTSGSGSVCILLLFDSFSPIDVPKEKADVSEDNVKIYSNPLLEFDDEYISRDVNPLFDDVLENIESKDSYDSNLDEPNLLVTPLFDANKDECFDTGGNDDEVNVLDCKDGYYDLKGDILYLKSLLSDDTTPNLPPKNQSMTSLTRLGATLAIPSIFIGGWDVEANQRSRSIAWMTNKIRGLGLEIGGASKRPE